MKRSAPVITLTVKKGGRFPLVNVLIEISAVFRSIAGVVTVAKSRKLFNDCQAGNCHR